jgi:hypothetical protein
MSEPLGKRSQCLGRKSAAAGKDGHEHCVVRIARRLGDSGHRV